MDKKFKPPDQKAIDRMTPASIESLLDTLRDQREAKVKLIDQEISWYENLLAKKNTKTNRA